MKKLRFDSRIIEYFIHIQKSIIACLLACSVMLFSCENDIKTINSLADIQNFPSQSAKNIEILYSDSAMVKLKIIAPEMARFTNSDEPYIEFKKGIEALFYDKEMKVETRMTSDYAIFYEQKEMWEARDNVVVNSSKSGDITTELLIWDQKKEIFYSDKYVKITSDDEILHGTGFEADQNFNNYTILQPEGKINLTSE